MFGNYGKKAKDEREGRGNYFGDMLLILRSTHRSQENFLSKNKFRHSVKKNVTWKDKNNHLKAQQLRPLNT